MSLNNQEIIFRTLEVFGSHAQMAKAIEELSELIRAVSRLLTVSVNDLKLKEYEENLAEELVDVEIVYNQLLMVLGAKNEELFNKLPKIRSEKLGRLLTLVEQEESKKVN